jgi:hypothetical protein
MDAKSVGGEQPVNLPTGLVPSGAYDGQMMFEQIAQDAAAGRFDAWASSTVIDENIQAPVISATEFAELHAAAGLSAVWPVGNAGLIHVYGYLLSTVVTPYGLKGDRWLRGDLARSLGLAPDAFRLESAASAGETVLQRVTDAALLHLVRPSVARGDVHVIDDEVPDDSDAEAAVAPATAPPVHATFFRTTVLQAPRGAALVYGVSLGGTMRLVTAFPLADPAASVGALETEPVRMRYNAALPGLPPRSPLWRRSESHAN